MKIKLSSIVDGIEFQGLESKSYFNQKTGEVVLFQDEEIRAAENNYDLSDQHEWYIEAVERAKQFLENDNDYIPLPTKFEFHEYAVINDFILSLPIEEQREELLNLIRGKGAFSRFRQGLERFLLIDKWHNFRDEAMLKFAKNWCQVKGIELENEL